MKSTEQNLHEQLQQGDKNAFIFIYDHYYDSLCLYAKRFVRRIDIAEEIVQDVIYKLWERRTTLVIPQHVKQYLFKAVYNTALNHLKADKNFKKYQEKLYNYLENSQEYTIDAISNELTEQIDSTIEALPEKCKTIFKMSRFDGLKYREIAEKLNISIKSVESYMTKALKSLTEALQEYLVVIIMIIINIFN